MKRPITDITTINAIQSLFLGRIRDPWAVKLAGHFADLYVYAEHVRYPLPIPEKLPSSFDPFSEPRLIGILEQRDSGVLVPKTYSTAEPKTFNPKYLESCFRQFVVYARNNPKSLGQWIRLHNQSWVRPVQGQRAQHRYVFDLHSLDARPEVGRLTEVLRCNRDDVYYAFDIILRVSLYGRMAGEQEIYLNHPIRDAFPMPTMQWDIADTKNPPVSFAASVSEIAADLNMDEYAVVLHELRKRVREAGLHLLGHRDVETEQLRELAAEMCFKPRVRNKRLAKTLGILSGVVAGAGAFPVLGPASAIVGAAITISSAIWTGGVPRRVSRWRWLRWLLEWELEAQGT